MIEKANSTSSHLVVGNRFRSVDGKMSISKSRLVAMKLLTKTFSVRAGINIRDTTSGFRLISRPLLDLFAQEFPNYYLGDTYEAMVFSAKNGFCISEIDVPFSDRTHGTSTSSNIHSVGRIIQLILEPMVVGRNRFF